MNSHRAWATIAFTTAFGALSATAFAAARPAAGDLGILKHDGFFVQHCASHGARLRPDVAPGNMTYHCGPVMTTPGVALIFWGTGSDPAGEVPYLTNFVRGIGASPWLNTVTQYYQQPPQAFISNPPNQLVGYFVDYNPIPTVPSIAQIAHQAVLVARKYGYSPNVDYFVALAPGHAPAFVRQGVACALHNWVTYSPRKLLAFTVFPYMPEVGQRCGAFLVNHPTPSNPNNGINDGTSIFASHEIAEAYTDPFGSGWYDSSGGSGEIGDKCDVNIIMPQNVAFPTGVFPVEPLWDNAISECAFSGP
jgi:hypothetical protein